MKVDDAGHLVPRILFYSHDGYGLGHARVALAVASEVAARRPDAALLLLMGSLQTPAHELPSNLDVVKLPSFDRRHVYAGLDGASPQESGIWRLRKAIAVATIAGFAPTMLVIDHAPAGLGGELEPILAPWRHAIDRPALVLLLRDITYGRERTRAAWQADGVPALLDKAYDRILVTGSRDVFDPVETYGFSELAAAKTEFAGYLAPRAPREPASSVRARLGVDRRLVLVTVGGGGDGFGLVSGYLDAVTLGLLPDVASFVVSGPLMPATSRARLQEVAGGLPEVALVPYVEDLESHIAAADAVVTMGGYNALREAVGLGKRPIVVPRPISSGSDEQVTRARRFAELGIATLIEPESLTPQRLATAIVDELARGTTPPRILDFQGLARIGDAIVDELRRREARP